MIGAIHRDEVGVVNAVLENTSSIYVPIMRPEFARTLNPGFDIRGLRGSQVDGTFDVSDLGGMVVADISLTPVHVSWRPQNSSPLIKVIFQEIGTSMSAQDGRRAVARPGDIFFFDSARPFALWTDGETRQHSIEFPRSLLADHVWRFTDLTALTIDGTRGAGRFLRTFIKTLIQDSQSSDQLVARRLRDHAVQLLLTAVWEQFEYQGSSDRSQKAQLRRAKAYALERLDDPDLDVESLAAGLNMSVRYLYYLFETEGLTVARWVRKSRLDRCRRELEDKESAGISICEIAMKHGFNDSAYFSTAFRTAFKITPSDYRRAALARVFEIT